MKAVEVGATFSVSSGMIGKFEMDLKVLCALRTENTLENAKVLIEFGNRMRVELKRYIENNEQENVATLLHCFAILEHDLNMRVPQSAFTLNKDNLEKNILINHYFLDAIETLSELGSFNKAFDVFESIATLANRMIDFHRHNAENESIFKEYRELKKSISSKLVELEKKFFNALAVSYLSSKNEAIPEDIKVALNPLQQKYFEQISNLTESAKSKALVKVIEDYIKTRELSSLFSLNVSSEKDSAAVSSFINGLIAIGYTIAQTKRELDVNRRNISDIFSVKKLNQLEAKTDLGGIAKEFDLLVEWVEAQKFHEVDLNTAKLKLKASSDALSAVITLYNKMVEDESIDQDSAQLKTKLLDRFTNHLKDKNKELVARLLKIVNVEPKDNSKEHIELLHAIIKQIPLLFSAHDRSMIVSIIKFSAEYIKLNAKDDRIKELKHDLINLTKNFNDAMYIYFGKIVLASITPGKTLHDYRHIMCKFAGKDVVSNLVDINMQSVICTMFEVTKRYKNKLQTLQKFKTLALGLETNKNIGLDINIVYEMLKEMLPCFSDSRHATTYSNIQNYIEDIGASIAALTELTYKPVDLSALIKDEEKQSKQKNKSVASSSSSSSSKPAQKPIEKTPAPPVIKKPTSVEKKPELSKEEELLTHKSVASSSSSSSSQQPQKAIEKTPAPPVIKKPTSVEKKPELSKEEELLTNGDWQTVGEKKKKVVEEVAPVVQQSKPQKPENLAPIKKQTAVVADKKKGDNAADSKIAKQTATTHVVSNVITPTIQQNKQPALTEKQVAVVAPASQSNIALADLQSIIPTDVKVVSPEPFKTTSATTTIDAKKEEVNNDNNKRYEVTKPKPKPFEFNLEAKEFTPNNNNNQQFYVQPVMVACTSFVPLGPIYGTPFVYGQAHTDYVPMIPLPLMPPAQVADVVHNQQAYQQAYNNNHGRGHGRGHGGGRRYY